MVFDKLEMNGQGHSGRQKDGQINKKNNLDDF